MAVLENYRGRDITTHVETYEDLLLLLDDRVESVHRSEWI